MSKKFLFLTSILGFLLALPMFAGAADIYPPVICTGLFGCGQPPDDVLIGAFPVVASILIQLAAGGAVIAIVIAGIQMAVAYADDGKVTNARKAILYALGGLGLALSAGSLVSFVMTEDYGQSDPDLLFGPAGVLASIVRIILMLSNVVFAIIVIIAGIRMVVAGGNTDEFKSAGVMIKWAIIGAVIVNIARALVQALLGLNL